MKILGTYGYSMEFPVERYYRGAKSHQIVEGSSNIQKLIIARMRGGIGRRRGRWLIVVTRANMAKSKKSGKLFALTRLPSGHPQNFFLC
jgi:Acyl-CoA dehydrogenase, C-terminal domain